MKIYRPTPPWRGNMSTGTCRGALSNVEPPKPLMKGRKRDVGRNAHGRITVRHKGGGHKRTFRFVDFMYEKRDIPARVETIEYDPNRSGFIGLLLYRDGERRYALLPKQVKPGANLLI